MPETFPVLKLPPIDARISQQGEEHFIYDVIRKKDILLTKEEWVRQHFVHLLIHQLAYPRGLIRVEAGLKYYKKAKRSDLLVYDPSGQVYLLLECKSPDVKLNSSTLDQLSMYNKTLKARYLAISNGLKHYCWEKDPASDGYRVLHDFPRYDLSSEK